MAKNLPVTAKNVACELMHRLHQKILHDIWLINCKVEATNDYARFLYLYDKDLSCAPDILKCIKLTVSTESKCTSTSKTITCSTVITQIPEESCSSITITEGIFTAPITS